MKVRQRAARLLVILLALWSLSKEGAPARQPAPDRPELFVGVPREWTSELAWSPDGRTLATASGDAVVLWDVATGRPARMLTGHLKAVDTLAWSPDGRRLATGAEKVIVWEAASGRRLATLPSSARSPAWSADGRWMATLDYGEGVLLWDAHTFRRRAVLQAATLSQRPSMDFIRELAWRPDGKVLAGAMFEGGVSLWEIPRGRRLRVIRDAQWPVRWSADGRLLASWSVQRVPTLWDARTGRKRATLGSPTAPSQDDDPSHSPRDRMAWQPGGALVATRRRGESTVVWDSRTGHRIALIESGSPADAAETLAWWPDGRALAVNGERGILLWDTATRQPGATLEGAQHGEFFGWSPDGRWLATRASGEEAALLWDAAQTAPPRELVAHLDTLRRVAWRPDGGALATSPEGIAEPAALLWTLRAAPPGAAPLMAPNPPSAAVPAPEIRSPATVQSRPATGERPSSFHTQALAWAPDGASLAAWLLHPREGTGLPFLYEGGVVLWAGSRAGGAPVSGKSAAGAGGPPTWHPSGKRFATPAGEGRAGIWRASGDLAVPLEETFSVAWSPDGRYLATAGFDVDGVVREGESGRQLATLEGSKRAYDLSWSPDGDLVTGLFTNTAFLWDGQTGHLRARLAGHRSDITGLSWSPDGQALLTMAARSDISGAAPDRGAMLWDARTGGRRALLAAGRGPVTGAAWSPDGHLLATIRGGKWLGGVHGESLFEADGESAIRLWDVATGRPKATLDSRAGPVLRIAWSPDGRVLASVSKHRRLTFWNPRGLPQAAQIASTALPGDAEALAWSQDSHSLAVVSRGAVSLWDASGRLRATCYSLNHGRDWLITTPAGYFAGTEEGIRTLQWREGNRLWPVERFRERFERLDEVTRALQSGTTPRERGSKPDRQRVRAS